MVYDMQGPDVFLDETLLEMEGVEYSVMLSGELWSEHVMLYYVENKPGAWARPVDIK
jgi:hypothetical protein